MCPALPKATVLPCARSIALGFLVIGMSCFGATVTPQLVSTLDGALMIAPDGSFWAWGGTHNSTATWFGDRGFSEKPERVGTDRDWRKVSGNFWTYLAIKLDGSLWSWGWQYAKNASSVDALDRKSGSSDVLTYVGSPTRIGTDGSWSEIAVGGGHRLALKGDGSLWTWGQNDHGQLGDATTNNRAVPMRLGPEADWKAIAAGAFTGFGLKRNGTLWIWGEQLGTPGDDPSTVDGRVGPHQIDLSSNWTAIAAGHFFFVALKSDGTLWIGGPNARSVCSDILGRSPVGKVFRVGEKSDWAEIYAGSGSFFARKKDGRWFACGQNVCGELGLDKQGSVGELERLFLNFDPWAFAPGCGNTLVLTKNGDLLTWGRRLGSAQSKTTITIKENLNSLLERLSKRLSLFDTERFKIDKTPVKLWELPSNIRGGAQL
jgi:alpha-tubulin suppressor-like RCC1 family protein